MTLHTVVSLVYVSFTYAIAHETNLPVQEVGCVSVALVSHPRHVADHAVALLWTELHHFRSHWLKRCTSSSFYCNGPGSSLWKGYVDRAILIQ